MSAAARLHGLARGWRTLRTLAWIGVALALISAVWLATRQPVPAAVAGLLVAMALAVLQYRRPISVHTVAAHLDRTVPELEESTSLLLSDPEAGPALARMQHRRTAAAFSRLDAVPRMAFPATRIAASVAVVVLLLTALATMLPRRAPASHTGALDTTVTHATASLALQRVSLRWTPPRYLGLPARDASTPNATVEDGSVVEWRVEATGATRVRIVDLLGDTLDAQATESGWRASATVTRPRVWRAEALDANGAVVSSEAYLLGVTPDRAPVIAIVAPPGRTAMDWDEPHRVVVRAVVRDDHAIGATALVATVAAGRGEGVRFRERRLELERESSTGVAQQVVSSLIDLDALGVAPGDEVYLVVEASDRRSPVPQVTRSETVFLAIRDTLDPVASDFGGIAVDIEPEFFRSQRQIILDTEALLAEVRAGRTPDPMPRAVDIGYDQYLLRVRYGEIAGQEDEVSGADPDAVITEADLMHMHDSEENATLLAASVKATLQQALAAMWEAEKQLRTGQPARALPHEYRALVALEQIRQAQRAYVKRIGFEPPAIDVDRTRLTKEARDLADLALRGTRTTPRPAQQLHDALAVIDSAPSESRTAILDAAARELASETLAGMRGDHLATLDALRQLLDGTDDHASRAAVRRGLLAALPVPPRAIVPVDPR